MRRTLQLPIYQTPRESIPVANIQPLSGLRAVIAWVRSRNSQVNTPNLDGGTRLYASSAYAEFSARQQSGRLR